MGWGWTGLENWLGLKILLGWAGDSVGLGIWLKCKLCCVGLDILLGRRVGEMEDLAGLDVWFGFIFALVADLVELGWDGDWDGQGISCILVGF